MTRIAIGDIHGNDIWKKIIEKPYDEVIFIGDYFDTFEDIPSFKQIYNFNEILDFKRANPDKVFVLFGNHEFHYLWKAYDRYGGYQRFNSTFISEVVNRAVSDELLQICRITDNIVFSHAGITKTWCANNGIINDNTLEQQINSLLQTNPNVFKFTSGAKNDKEGDETCQSPIWVRPRSLRLDVIDGYDYHVVGHTVTDSLIIKDSIIEIDTINTSKEYLKITDGILSVEKI